MADDVDEGLPERPGAALLVEQSVPILEDPSAVGDVLAGADHPERSSLLVAEEPPRAVGPVDRPIGPDDAELELEGVVSVGLHGRTDRALERAAVVWVDRVEIGGELRAPPDRAPTRAGEDRVRPGQRAGLDIPFPEPGPRRRQHQLEPCVAPFDLLGKGRHLVERIRQSVA